VSRTSRLIVAVKERLGPNGGKEAAILTEISDRTIILTSIKHDQVKKRSNMEIPPDTKVVVHVDLARGDVSKFCSVRASPYLPNRHPLEVCTYGVHLSLVCRYAAVFNEGCFSVVEF